MFSFEPKNALLALSALSLMACGGAAGGAAADSMKYLPEGSKFVSVIDVKKAVTSPLLNEEPFKSAVADFKQDGDYKKLVESGIDPFTNVTTVMTAGDVAKQAGVSIISGTFDAAKVAEKAKTTMGNEAVVEVLGTGMIIIGTKDAVASAKLGKGLDGSPEVKGLLGLVDNSKTFFAVGAIPGEMIPPMATMFVPQAKNIKGAGASIDASNGIDLKIVARFASDADATGLKTTYDGMAAGKVKEMGGDLANNLKVEAKGTDLNVSLTLTVAQVKDAAAKLNGLGGMLGGGMGGGMPAMPDMPAPAPTPAMPMPAPGADPAAPAPAAPGAGQ